MAVSLEIALPLWQMMLLRPQRLDLARMYRVAVKRARYTRIYLRLIDTIDFGSNKYFNYTDWL